MRCQSSAHDSEIHAYNDSDLQILKTRREGYLKIFENMENSVIIDGSKSKEEISDEIWGEVSSCLNP